MEIAKTIAPFCLIIIMFGLGIGLTVADFTRLIKIPRDFIVGFFGQVILLPIVAFILIQIISLSPELALGTMIIAADRKSTRLNSSHGYISYAVFCLKKKKQNIKI